jgi:hypothetical protein
MTVAMGATGSVQAVKFEFHGDLDHRFTVFTDQVRFPGSAELVDGGANDNIGEAKYRLWTTAATDDDKVKGVFAVEVGGINFGSAADGGAFSGDGRVVEARWAYLDYAAGPGRIKMGLQPYSLNKHLWKETATGIQFAGAFGGGDTKYNFAWMRGRDDLAGEETSLGDELDALSAKFDFSPWERVKLGVFGLFQQSSDKDVGTTIDCSPTGSRRGARCWEVKNFVTEGADFSLTSIGVDGSYTKPTDSGNFFINWDVIVQDGSLDNTAFTGTDGTSPAFLDFDVSGQMFRFEVGARRGKTTYKYTLLQQSGDDDPNDDDFEAFLATDMDSSDSAIFNEGNLNTDFFFTETNYFFDKGIFMNKFSVDHQINKKLKVGGSVALMALAEDVQYVNGVGTRFEEDALGVELQGRVTYSFATRTVWEAQLAFLAADDAMDFFEGGVDGPPQDGDVDEDIVRLETRVRYKF